MLGAAILVIAAVVFVAWPTFWAAVLSDPEREVLTIENRTDAAIIVYLRYPDDSEHPTELIPTIPPQARVETELPCGAGALVARAEEGSLVAKRGPFPECNLEDWIIGPQ